MSSLQSFTLSCFKMAEMFRSLGDILCDWAKDKVQNSLAKALNRLEKREKEI